MANSVVALMRWAAFYGQLRLLKHIGSTIDRKTLLTLNGGGSWSRNFNYSATVKINAFNITGYIHPGFVHQMLHSSDHDGMNDRQLFDFSSKRDVFLDQLNVLVPEDIPNVKGIFCELRNQHQQSFISWMMIKLLSKPTTTLSGRCWFKMEMLWETAKSKQELNRGMDQKVWEGQAFSDIHANTTSMSISVPVNQNISFNGYFIIFNGVLKPGLTQGNDIRRQSFCK